MRFRFEMDGAAYSRHKDSFKRLLAKHGLRWRGTLEHPMWASGSDRVNATFDRDDDKDVLRHATLVWEGRRKSPLLEDLKAWSWQVGGKTTEEAAPSTDEVSEEVETALTYWDIVWKPNVDWLRSQGRPSTWIEEDVRKWKRARQERRRELMGQAVD
jgi:hypothetical protein